MSEGASEQGLCVELGPQVAEVWWALYILQQSGEI